MKLCYIIEKFLKNKVLILAYAWGDSMNFIERCKQFLHSAKGQLGSPMKIVMIVIGMVILFNVLVALLPTAATDINSLLGHVSTNSTTYGTGPAALATTFSGIWGYVLVAGLIGLIFVGVMKLTGKRRRL